MAGKLCNLHLNQHGLAEIYLLLLPFLMIFCGGFHQKDLKFHTFMVFFEQILLQSCILHKDISTEARIHQKSDAHFTLVCWWDHQSCQLFSLGIY